jgi:hypothetical protein
MISYNKATFFGTGGGVNVGYDGYFSLSGGEISYNTAEYYGGGVNNNGDFRMLGGKITNNKVTDSSNTIGGGGVNNRGSFMLSNGIIAQNTAPSGGGVLTGSNDFAMSGGEISGNTATTGGGVHIEYGSFRLTGGKISGNTATNSGGGVWVRIEELNQFSVSNGVVFSNNRASEAYDRSSEYDEVYAKQIGSSVTWTTPFTQGYNNYDIGYTSNAKNPDVTPNNTPLTSPPNRTPFTVSPSAPISSDSSEELDFRIVAVVIVLGVTIVIITLVYYRLHKKTITTRR